MENKGGIHMGDLEEFLGNTPEIKVLDFFLDAPVFDYSIPEIAAQIGLSEPSVAKAIVTLMQNHIVISRRSVGKARMYMLIKNDITRALLKACFAHTKIVADVEDSSAKQPHRHSSLQQKKHVVQYSVG
jgi:DNA-binding transcriptional regulator GbsR (MarR family)